MKPMVYYFSMNAEKWQHQRSKGFWHYVFFKGVFCLGICGGIIILSLQYWQNLGFSLSEISFYIWFSDHLIWLPISTLAGFFI